MGSGSVTERRWLRGFLVVAVAAMLLSTVGCGSESAPPDVASPTPGTESAKEVNPDLAQRLDSTINQAMTDASIPGAIVGVWGPEGHYVRAFGVADKATRAPMKTDFYHRIGSVTKTFTVTAVLQLADQDKLSLDDPIAKYIDDVPNGDTITLHQLAGMRSGLVNYTSTTGFQQAIFADPQRDFTPQEVLAYAFAEPPVFPPGEGLQYSNTNTILLGLVVEKVSWQTLPDYIRHHILVPLDLQDTSFPTSNAFPTPHAQGYTNQTADGAEAVATDWDPSWGWAAGAMISTLEDLHRWAPELATGRLLSPDMQRQRLQTVNAPGLPPQDGYGLGIFNLAGWIGHNGSLPGYQTVAVQLPEEQRTLVILVNTDIGNPGSEPGTALATAITTVITPDHVYSLRPAVQAPDITESPAPPRPR